MLNRKLLSRFSDWLHLHSDRSSRKARRNPFLGPRHRPVRLETLEQRVLLSSDGLGFQLEGIPIYADGEGPITNDLGDDLVKFAKDLSAKNVVLYGADWSTSTSDQKRLFDDGAKHLTYIDVTNSDRTPNQTAIDKAITTYPTWIFADGGRLEGIQSLKAIGTRANVPIPRSDAPYLEAIENVTVGIGSPLHIPIDAYHPLGLPLTISVTSDKPDRVVPTVLSGNRNLLIKTDFGDMNFQLFEDKAPRPAERVIQLAEDGFYDGILFHRVIDGFMIQGGDPAGTGSGGSPLGNFADQFNLDLQHNRSGILSFAKSSDDTNNSQFFITAGPTRHLDFNHSVFGQLVEGDSTRQAINQTATGANDRPTHDVAMKTVSVFTDSENGLVLLKPTGTGTITANVTVTVSDGRKSARRTFVVTVVADTANGAPFLNDLPSSMNAVAGIPLNFNLTSQDKEGDTVTYAVQALGSVPFDVSVTASGVVTLNPPVDFEGDLPLAVGVWQTNPSTTGDRYDTQVLTVRVHPNWQNEREPLDVNADGRISPQDALIVINYLNTGRTRDLPSSGLVPPPFIDVNGDRRVSPQDALLVINRLNQGSPGEGEGSAAGSENSAGNRLNSRKTQTPIDYWNHPTRNPNTFGPQLEEDEELLLLLGGQAIQFQSKVQTVARGQVFAEMGAGG